MWRDDHGPHTLSVAQLSDAVLADSEFRQVLDLYIGRPDYDLTKEIGRLIKDEAVPYLAVHRYKPSGIRKRAAWEETWELLRPDRPVPEDRHGPGIPRDRIERVVARLEAL